LKFFNAFTKKNIVKGTKDMGPELCGTILMISGAVTSLIIFLLKWEIF
jgi:hypothetical protein